MKKGIAISASLLLVLAIVVSTFFGYQDKSVEELKLKYANEESKFIEVEGIDVHFRDEGSGTPLVLLHGTAASLHTWDGWTNELKNDFRIIRVDLPAFGLTGPAFDGQYTIDNYTHFLDAFIQKLSLDSIYLAGNSLGGNIAWAYALNHQEVVKKLVLIDASGIPKDTADPFAFRVARTPIIGNLLKFITPKAFIRKSLKEVYFDETMITDKLVERYHDMALREGNRQAFIDRAFVKNPDTSSALKELQTPTLLLWGKEDIWVPMSSFDAFKSLIPNLKTALLDNLGHVPMEEAPVLTSKIAMEFLQQE